MSVLRLLLVLALAGFLENKARESVSQAPRTPEPASTSIWQGLIGPEVPRLFLGNEGMVASLLWISAVTEAADHLKPTDDRSALGSLLVRVVYLDSSWEYPHIFGGLLLDNPKGEPFPEALGLLEAACRRFPDQWRTPVLYSQKIQRATWLPEPVRADSAYQVLLPLSQRADVPPFVRTLAFTARLKGGDTAEAVGALLIAWRMSGDPISASVFREKVRKILTKFPTTDPSLHAKALLGLERIILSEEETETALEQFATQIRDPAQRLRAFQILAAIGGGA
jgi:hypothetical protein